MGRLSALLQAEANLPAPPREPPQEPAGDPGATLTAAAHESAPERLLEPVAETAGPAPGRAGCPWSLPVPAAGPILDSLVAEGHALGSAHPQLAQRLVWLCHRAGGSPAQSVAFEAGELGLVLVAAELRAAWGTDLVTWAKRKLQGGLSGLGGTWQLTEGIALRSVPERRRASSMGAAGRLRWRDVLWHYGLTARAYRTPEGTEGAFEGERIEWLRHAGESLAVCEVLGMRATDLRRMPRPATLHLLGAGGHRAAITTSRARYLELTEAGMPVLLASEVAALARAARAERIDALQMLTWLERRAVDPTLRLGERELLGSTKPIADPETTFAALCEACGLVIVRVDVEGEA